MFKKMKKRTLDQLVSEFIAEAEKLKNESEPVALFEDSDFRLEGVKDFFIGKQDYINVICPDGFTIQIIVHNIDRKSRRDGFNHYLRSTTRQVK